MLEIWHNGVDIVLKSSLNLYYGGDLFLLTFSLIAWKQRSFKNVSWNRKSTKQCIMKIWSKYVPIVPVQIFFFFNFVHCLKIVFLFFKLYLMEIHSYVFNMSTLMKLNFLNSMLATLLSLKLPNSIWKGLSLLGCAKDSIRLPRGCQKFSKLTLHWVKSYSEKVHTYVTIFCLDDELSSSMSWLASVFSWTILKTYSGYCNINDSKKLVKILLHKNTPSGNSLTH